MSTSSKRQRYAVASVVQFSVTNAGSGKYSNLNLVPGRGLDEALYRDMERIIWLERVGVPHVPTRNVMRSLLERINDAR